MDGAFLGLLYITEGVLYLEDNGDNPWPLWKPITDLLDLVWLRQGNPSSCCQAAQDANDPISAHAKRLYAQLTPLSIQKGCSCSHLTCCSW